MDQNIQISNALTEYKKKKAKSLKKSMISTVVLLVITVIIFSAQTYAYFSESVASDRSRIAAGNLDVELIKTQNGVQTDHAVTPVNILPATSIKQGISVQNAGNLPVYVRIKIEKTILQSENEMPVGWESLILCNFDLDDESTPDISEGSWRYLDGYYYYIVDIAPGSTTAPLFDTIIFSPKMGNEFKNSKIQFKVVCQSVQSTNNSDSPMTAWGWPAAPATSD